MLREFGIHSYILSESCIRIGGRHTPVSLEDTFTDLLNLGRIFRVSVEARAEEVVRQQRSELEKNPGNVAGGYPASKSLCL